MATEAPAAEGVREAGLAGRVFGAGLVQAVVVGDLVRAGLGAGWYAAPLAIGAPLAAVQVPAAGAQGCCAALCDGGGRADGGRVGRQRQGRGDEENDGNRTHGICVWICVLKVLRLNLSMAG